MCLFFRPLNQSCLHSDGSSSSFNSVSLSLTHVITWVIVKALFFRANMSVYIMNSHVVMRSIRALSLISTFPDLLNWRSPPASVVETARISRTIIVRWESVILAHVRQISRIFPFSNILETFIYASYSLMLMLKESELTICSKSSSSIVLWEHFLKIL